MKEESINRFIFAREVFFTSIFLKGG